MTNTPSSSSQSQAGKFEFQSLADHPRLYVGPTAWQQLEAVSKDPWYQSYLNCTTLIADQVLDPVATMADFKEQGHNWHLIRARLIQKYTCSLIVQYRLTGQAKYKTAVMAWVQQLHDFEYWSWISWRANDNDPSHFYDLSYGENSATLAIVHDWLADELTADDKALILATAQRPINCLLRPFTPDADGKMPQEPWWFGHTQSNWNTVCAGGIGMLALSLFEQLPEAKQLLEIVEASIKPYMKALVALDGAWPEGIGYWNYGMRYAFMYLLSYEQATGQKHWAMEQPATRASLDFPVAFCPNGVPCSYGDVNSWVPLPFHHAVARRLGADDLAAELFAMHPVLSPASHNHGQWPSATETLLLVRRVMTDTQAGVVDMRDSGSTSSEPFVKLYRGQDWGVMADRELRPSLFMTVRGGTTEAPHGHMDVTSFHAGVHDEPVIFNQGINEYLDTTFSPKRFFLYDSTPASKNVVLVSGAGVVHPSKVTTKIVSLSPQLTGFHMEAAQAMGMMHEIAAVNQYNRLFLMIDNQALLVLDHVILPQPGRMESRLHTPMTISPAMSMAESIASSPKHSSVLQLTGKQQKAEIHLACSEPARVFQAVTLATTPTRDIRVIRWIGDELYSRIAFGTLILPEGHNVKSADATAVVNVTTNDEGVDVTLNLPWGQGEQTLKLNATLDALR